MYKQTKSGFGRYYSGKEELYLVAGLSMESFASMVVHEVTHSIQDWLDLRNVTVRDIETDAYIAQGVAYHASKRKLKESDHPLNVAYHGASRMVASGHDATDGKTKSSGKSNEWEAAVNNVGDAVAKHPLYKKKIHQVRNFKKEDDIDERATYLQLLKKLLKDGD